MVYVPAVGVAQINLVFSYLGAEVHNTLYFTGSLEWSATELTSLCNDVSDWWEARIKPSVSTALTMVKQIGTNLTTQSSPSVESFQNAGVTGDQTSPAMPGNAALVVKFSTELRGRNFRGRNYVCGLVEGLVTGNAVSSAVTDAIVAGYQAIPTDVQANFAEHVVVSREFLKAPRLTAVITPVTEYSSDSLVHTQRMRLT